MICIEGAGSFSQVSLRHRPQVYFEPVLFSAISVKEGADGRNLSRLLAGPVPDWKLMFPWGEMFEASGDGAKGRTFGLPRFEEASFTARFPFATVCLSDPKFPLSAQVLAWNPFIPNEADHSSLPVAGLEYQFSNTTSLPIEAVFSFHAENFMATGQTPGANRVTRTDGGFVLEQSGNVDRPWEEGYFAAWIDDKATKVNPAWFRGEWFDPLTMVWKTVQEAACIDQPVLVGPPSPGGSLYLPLTLAPGESKTIILKWTWYVPFSELQINTKDNRYRPWYSKAFSELASVVTHWQQKYDALRTETERFSDTFYDSTLPPIVLEAISANLAILKSPTVLRQADGRIWAWEGCHDTGGSCEGTCTHVWNYAQAVPHLFAELERGLRHTEFHDSQNDYGHQNFRTTLPIGPRADHSFHAAADGQLGGVIKIYREWRISGDSTWLASLWPRVQQSLNYCIETWDPSHRGMLVEPHHNTYDVEFWGEEGMCGSFYLAALSAATQMGQALGSPVVLYETLLASGKAYFESHLFNGEYFQQNTRWKDLREQNPSLAGSIGLSYSPEALTILKTEGPKYQYGAGCLSDGIVGEWMAWTAGLPLSLDTKLIERHLDSVYKYNFKEDLSVHANPQRSSYALGHEAGLLLCTWPLGNRLSLPLPYSEEVWTGIEYQVASHLISRGRFDEGIRMVDAVRARYSGRRRNPFGEYECGHWYARAMSSYALLQAISGARFDAVDRVLYLEPNVSGDFRSFLCTATGFGTVGVKDGKPFIEVKRGIIDATRIEYRRYAKASGTAAVRRSE